MKSLVLVGVLVLLIVVGALWYMEMHKPMQPPPTPPTAVTSAEVEAYVRANIGTLSPEDEVLGGTFYVSRIEMYEGTGTVWYEDGHNAFVADFTYDPSVRPISITSFTLRAN